MDGTRYKPNIYNEILSAEPDSGNVIKRGDMLADKLAAPIYGYVRLLI